MEFYCTTCCREKDRCPTPMAAIKRYLDPRIYRIFEHARSSTKLFVIFSGLYGFVEADEKIDWYDKALTELDIPLLLPLMVQQLQDKGVTSLVFYGLPASSPGWFPYHRALEEACTKAGIGYCFRPINPERPG